MLNKDLSVILCTVYSGSGAEPFHLAALINRPDMTNVTKHDLIQWLADKPIKHWQEPHFKNRVIITLPRKDDLFRESLIQQPPPRWQLWPHTRQHNFLKKIL